MNSPIYEPINDVVEVETNMSYSRFNLETVEQTFGLNIIENLDTDIISNYLHHKKYDSHQWK